ncbi:precorrin-8X methylmutase [Methanocaldococcus villosus KIN24-T80]|uniref:Precorrin-8X methylmutase n=1 Tax=Methanocaldococcus villosus KIN24-T80 TaxID=1069083 RepID=N6VSE7_9EURY|nr:cobalt-precorrin-8 methylmutase [Methanocaldococcus villosus]ENN96066.1 precorrin-8X methylmutase [Methanocaldococcus villosus KIN24-T80]
MGAISKDGLEIAKRAREIVREKIKDVLGEKIKNFSKEELLIIERVVHATADPEYAKLLVFKNNPIYHGVKAIKEGKPIITDVNMVKAGIRYDKTYCFIDDERAYELAKQGITRAVASMRLAKEVIDGGIVVIGNAPTALLELINLINSGIKPKLVIAVPVGFVKASEAKEMIRNTDVPSISTIGPKGGSSVAVAIANGIIALSKNERV